MTSTTTEQGTHTVADGTKLYTKTWKPAQGQPRAILAFVHGFSDHCNAYYELFPTLAAQGIEVRAFDQRGWGRSVAHRKDRGRTGPTTTVLSDMHSFFLAVNQRAAADKIPLFLLGHSMGGAQVLYYILHPDSPFNTEPDASKRPNFAGVMAYSPLIALHPSSRPSIFTVKAGRFAGKLMPNYQRYSPLDPRTMSRDETVCADWAQDELCHDTGTLEGMAGMLDRGIWLEELSGSSPNGKAALDAIKSKKTTPLPPMWFGHGSGDLVTDFEATKRLAASLGADVVTFRPYDGGYHKLHADLPQTKEPFAKDVAEWILERCPAESGAAAVVPGGDGDAAVAGERAPAVPESEGVLNVDETGDKSKL